MATQVDNARDPFQEFSSYVIGLLLALSLTAVPFALVAWKLLPTFWVLTVTFVLGLLQVVVHFRFFLHISLSRSSRDDLYLLLFSLLIILLLVGGTLIIMFNLHHRMM